MKKNRPELPSGLRIEPLDRGSMRMLQGICTWLGFARSCPYGACRRAARCATREVVCWQTLREPLQPLVLWVMAKLWQMAVERGEDPDVAPVYVSMYQRLVQREYPEVMAEVMQRVDRLQAGQPANWADEDWDRIVARARADWTSPDVNIPGCAETPAASDKHL